VLGLVGALAGGAVGYLGHLLLHDVGFAPPPTRGRLLLVAPAVLAWLVLIGGVLGAAGRDLLRWAEEAMLPADLSESTRLLYRLAGLVALAAVVHYYVVFFILRDPVDLPTFLLAARAVAAGADLYDPTVLAGFAGRAVPGGQALPYLYLPLYAVLLGPLAAMPLPTAYAAFLIFDAVLWATLVVLSFKLVRPAQELRAPLCAVALLVTASFLPAIQTLHHGSPSLVVAVLVVGGLVLERSGRSRSAGLVLALAVLIKVVPVLVLAYLAFRRRWTALVWSAIAGAGLLGLSVAVAGFDAHVRWLTEIAPGLAAGAETGTWFEPACHPENQSVTGVLCRFLGSRTPGLSTISSAVAGALVLLAALSMARRRRSEELPAVETSLVIVTLLLASTITWFHHMTLMLPVVLTLFVAAAGSQGLRRGVLGAAALAVLVTVGFEFLLDPWPFVAPNPLTRSLRFLAMALAYGCLVVSSFTAARGGGRA